VFRPKHPKKHALPLAVVPTEAEAGRARLFSPLRLRSGLTLADRTWIPAMVPWRATDEGFVTPAVLDWYARFAEGQPAVLVVEATGIRDVASGPLLRIGHDRFLEGLERLTRTVERESGGRTRLFIQLIDFLRIRRRPDPARYFASFLEVSDAHRERLAKVLDDARLATAPEGEVRAALAALDEASLAQVLDEREIESLTKGFRQRVTDLDDPEIRDLPATLPPLFAEAAARAKRVGFDGVELHYAHAYTMASFLSRRNTRDDGWGGSLDGRARLPLEVFRAVRAEVGDDYTVGCRMLADEIIPGGSDVADASAFAVRFAEAGMDFLSLSTGGKFEDAARPKIGEAAYPYTGESGFECMPTVHADERGPFARNVPKQAAVRRAVRDAGYATPVVVAGGIGEFSLAEGILQRDEADLIGAARQSLADPDWFSKLRHGRGAEIRRCRYTNYCEALDQKHKAVTCQLWDRTSLDEPGILLTPDGRRRLSAPRSP
jgi:2,4-dienoyl-CoA reductase-like NADH-dependent reductase (Old Yellow Enzyme family)